MNRIPAALYKRQDPVEPTLASRDSEGSARVKAKVSQTNYIGKVQAAESLVVRNVHEYSIWANWR